MLPSASPPDMDAVFRSYHERIRRYVLLLVRDPELARDLTQETFLRAHRQLGALRNGEALGVWLYRIATRLCVDVHRRALRRAEKPSEVPPSEPDRAAEPEAPALQLTVEQAEMSVCVRSVLEALPDSYRAVLLLHEIDGMTGPEVARHLGCSLPTAKIRLHRARGRLEAALRAACAISSDERGVVVCEPRGVDDREGLGSRSSGQVAEPQLTAAIVSWSDHARSAFELLMRRIEQPELPPQQVRFSPPITLRASTGPVPVPTLARNQRRSD